ncbi:MAG: formate dehydrogenase accessory sulfurtransferase FdhD [Castellaniella sp.]
MAELPCPTLPAPVSRDTYRSHPVWRPDALGLSQDRADDIAVERPLALEYNGISHAVMLGTPADLEDLALGFSFTEGIVRSAADVYDITTSEQDDGLVIRLDIAGACLHRLRQRRRQLAGRTGCGLCGLDSLTEVRRPLRPVVLERPLDDHALVAAARNLFDGQPLHQLTGATHAAGWADATGRITCIREDVGRHNALDKLVGHMLRRCLDPQQGLAIVSSRASFEMVQKAAAAGIAILAAVSAPTSYAITLAQELNVMLAGFVREQRYTVYTHPGHLRTRRRR